MALTISQIIAASYEDVQAKKPSNQWADSSFLQACERLGLVQRINGGPTIEEPLDYQSNQDADFLATDFTEAGLAKTEVLTAASYTPAQLGVPVKWSMGDEAKNPEQNQKVALVASLLDNAFTSHDEMIEEALFASSATDGFHGLPVIVPQNGQGQVGGIDASVETWWRNPTNTYNSNFSDIEATLTTTWNSVAKGSGSSMTPKLLVGLADAHAGYEGQLQGQIRYRRADTGDAGFKNLAFKTAEFVFSQYAPTTGDDIWLLNKAFKLKVFKNAYRRKGKEIEIPQAYAYIVKIYSALQATVSAKSRLGIVYHS